VSRAKGGTPAQQRIHNEWGSSEFDRPRDIGRVDFMMSGRSLQDYPRHVEVVATGVGERVLFSGPILGQLAQGIVRSPELPVASIALPRNQSTRVVIRQLGQSRRWGWSRGRDDGVGAPIGHALVNGKSISPGNPIFAVSRRAASGHQRRKLR
jgi:hypothetical protein